MKKLILTGIILSSSFFVQADFNGDFLQAARTGNIAGIHAALLNGASINAIQPDGRNAFMLASNQATLEALLQAPSFLKINKKALQCLGLSNISKPDKTGMTPLVYAIIKNDIPRVKVLVKHGVQLGGRLRYMDGSQRKDVNVLEFVKIKQGEAGDLYKYLYDAYNGRKNLEVAYIAAVANGDLSGVKDALVPPVGLNKFGGSDLNVFDTDYNSPYLLALQHGQMQMLNFLAKEAQTFMCVNNMVPQIPRVNSRNKEGINPLHYAITHNNTDAVKVLLASGANLTGQYSGTSLVGFVKNHPNPTMKQLFADAHLFYLIQNGTIDEINKSLAGTLNGLPGSQVNARNHSYGSTPSMIAAVTGQVEKLDDLTTKGADITPSMVNNHGSNTLMQAALYGQAAAIDKIIPHGYGSAQVNQKNAWGQTALMLAAQYGRLQAIQKLLSAGANKTIVDDDGHNALWYLDNASYASKMYQYKWNTVTQRWGDALTGVALVQARAAVVNALTP
jgi:ankyrin repeat protein